MKDNFSEFDNLINQMKSVPQVTPPADVVTRVMARLDCEKEKAQLLFFRRFFPTDLNFGFHSSVTKMECAFYFFLTGFFYFILGLIMMIGLPLPAIMQNNDWIAFQPLCGLVLAAELFAIGIVLFRKGDSAVPFARLGTLIYAALVVLNYWIGAFYIQTVTALLFIAIFSITGLVLAVLLKLAIDHYHPETIFSEVHG